MWGFDRGCMRRRVKLWSVDVQCCWMRVAWVVRSTTGWVVNKVEGRSHLFVGWLAVATLWGRSVQVTLLLGAVVPCKLLKLG